MKAQPALDDDPERYVQLFSDMQETMMELGGVGIAAPQIGVSVAACIIAPTREYEKPMYLLNPRIVKTSGILYKHVEGCLSCPKPLTVRRHTSVTVSATDAVTLETLKIKLAGFPAAVYQHEIDHLQGLTIIQRASMR